MKKSFVNNTHIEGKLYNHDLTLKVTGENSKAPGTEFIAGNIEIATDDAGVNIVPVHFTYVTATTSKGKTSTPSTPAQTRTVVPKQSRSVPRNYLMAPY